MQHIASLALIPKDGTGKKKFYGIFDKQDTNVLVSFGRYVQKTDW
jgi:hypothetical protein